MEIDRFQRDSSQMDPAARIEWEWYRVGGKWRYLLRNAVAWTVAIEVPLAILRFAMVALDSGLGGRLLDFAGELVFSLGLITLVNWAWLSIKWDRNEAAWQKSVGNNIPKQELSSGNSRPA